MVLRFNLLKARSSFWLAVSKIPSHTYTAKLVQPELEAGFQGSRPTVGFSACWLPRLPMLRELITKGSLVRATLSLLCEAKG